ncbi:hypothetical protein MTP99_005597 [Tenebrio molitor]|nr:hypothetical protein MTP99_005597 [Tenebrio molitor]
MCDKKKKVYVQKYCKAWEKEATFKEWLGPDQTGVANKAFCKYCKQVLQAHRKDLVAHANTTKHKNKLPARSPDLNPIEHALEWNLLGNGLTDHLSYPENIRELSELLPILWQQIPRRRLRT